MKHVVKWLDKKGKECEKEYDTVAEYLVNHRLLEGEDDKQ
jgi:hypothetical protein